MRRVPLAVPVLLVHAADDATVTVRRSRAYAQAARAAGGSVEVLEPAAGGHRGVIDPGTDGWAAAVAWLAAHG
jgi:alpha-beta hydrolase superfamily lysophospholipase